MKEQSENKNSGIQRYFIAHRTGSLNLIAFDRLTRTNYKVRFLNLSVSGVGIELSEQIEPGLVCFEEQVGGHKFGVITWCRPNENGEGYRAGIHFITLPYQKEKYILKQVSQSLAQNTLRDPEKIIAGLLDSIKAETNG